jgi:hypothetical protein
MARTKKALTEFFDNLRAEVELVGLCINEDKTNYMHIKRTDLINIPLHIKNFSFESVCSFTYLGFLLSANNVIQPEISERIFKGIET